LRISALELKGPFGNINIRTAVLLYVGILERNNMKHLSHAEIAVIKARILRGDRYQDIAADYRINQGRIADLKFGRIYKEVKPVELDKH